MNYIVDKISPRILYGGTIILGDIFDYVILDDMYQKRKGKWD